MLSCSSDNNHRGGLTIEQLFPTMQRKISQIMVNYGYYEGYCGIYKYTFHYIDDKFQSVDVDHNEGNYSISVSYTSDSYITIYDIWDNYNANINNIGNITLTNNSPYPGRTLYSYDHGHLINESFRYTIKDYIDESNTVITWKNGNIIKTRSELYLDADITNTWEKTYKYNSKLTQLVNLDLNWFVNPMDRYCLDIDYIIGTAGFMGAKCKNYMIEQRQRKLIVNRESIFLLTFLCTFLLKILRTKSKKLNF